MPRALVTGGAGFIGSHLVDGLIARGIDVRILDLLTSPVHAGVVPDYIHPEAEFIRGDVRDPECMRDALRDVEYVFHLAAYQDYLPDFSTFFTTNAASTALLYELIVAERRSVELVVVASSQAVYGEGRYRCGKDGDVYPGPRSEEQLERSEWDHLCPQCGRSVKPGWTDETVMNPHNSYGLSKRDQDEIAVKLGARYKIPSVAFRYSIVQGPRQSFRNAYSGALRNFTVQLGSGVQPLIFEDGRQIRDYVGVQDVVRATLLPLQRAEMHGASFNVGGDRSVTVLELADLVGEAAGVPCEPRISGLYRVGDTRHVRSDVSRLKGQGWFPEEKLRDVVRGYVAWALEHREFHNAAAAAQERMKQLGVLREAPTPVESS
jgi:dTDP-L-rhamnose 4-epimerase